MDEDEIKVSLASGQVELSNENSKGNNANDIELKSDQAVVYNLNEKVFDKITGFNPVEEFGWKDGIIYFNKAGLITVIHKLEQWYNVRIEIINDPTTIWSYSGKFQNATLENVLNSIGHTERFDFRIEQDKVIIKFKTDDNDTYP
jgi:ferric-dicitrate binding protein FerR (iron transport regulator)